MNKLWLIIQREYLTRVKKKSFILATVLTPLAFGLFFIVVGFIFSYESGDVKKIAISDPGNMLSVSKIKNTKSIVFSKPQKDLEALKKDVLDEKYDGVIAIPIIKNIYDKNVVVDYFYAEDNLDIDSRKPITKSLQRLLRTYKVKELNIDKKHLEALDSEITLKTKSILGDDKKDTSMNALVGAGIGGMMGMIMYMTVFIYGMMVMQSVREEKISRIAEVMISSVKPFQLMMGKIIGVGAVGLTQITIWAILIPIISILVQLFFGFDANEMSSGMDMASPDMDPEEMQFMVTQVIAELKSQNWLLMAPLFLLYYLGGYFLYASLFAAVGSAMEDDMGEGQALTIPITIPVVIAFYIMIVSVKSPNSSLAVWSSIFPLFSPIVMPARLAFSPPAWQIALSLIMLIATAIFFVWVSARIYRVGILMYGKKVTFKELGTWMFRK